MAKRAAYTLLLIKSDLVARADFGPLPQLKPMGCWEVHQSPNTRFIQGLETAMSLGGKCGKTAWVLGEALWTQTLSLSANALGGLSRDQIAKAIGFDVEALTGVSGADSSLGFCKAAPTDQQEHLWVTQLSLAARLQIQSEVEAAGATLGGILHPGGVPESLDADFHPATSNQSWRRIEVWKDTTLCLAGGPERGQRLTIINGDPAQDAWRANVSRWVQSQEAEHSEWLGPQGSMADEESADGHSPWTILPALTGKTLQEWMSRSALKLTEPGTAAVPIIEPGRADTRHRKQSLAIAAVILLCIGGCVLHWVWMANQRAAALQQKTEYARQVAEKTRRLQQLEAPKRAWDQLEASTKSLKADLATKQAERSRMVIHVMPDFQMQRHRLGDLLSSLARNSNSDLMIDRIAATDNGVMSIEGKCLPNSGLDKFAMSLSASLSRHGWQISPAQRTSTGLIPAGQFKVQASPLFLQQNADAPPEQTSSPSALAGGGGK